MQRRALTAILAAAALAAAGCGEPANERMTLAVIGDTPYGPEQIAAFPELVEDVNGDPDVDAVFHLGDVKLGTSPCTDERLETSLRLYQTFADPFVLTPGTTSGPTATGSRPAASCPPSAWSGCASSSTRAGHHAGRAAHAHKHPVR